MVQGLRLTISRQVASTSAQGAPRTLLFRSFPVRIGREASNDCVLGELFVSRDHGRIELEDGQLVLYDHASKCGTFVRQQTERVQRAVALTDVGGQFQIGTLTFHAELVDANEVQAGDVERVLGNACELLGRRREDLGYEVLALLSGLEAPERAQALCVLVQKFPELRQVPGLAELISSLGVAGVTPAANAAQSAIEALLRRYVAAPGLEDREEVTGFVARLDAAFECLLEGVSGLLVAYGCEIGDEGLVATSRATLAARLLGASDDRAAEQLRDTFLAMVRHHTNLSREAVEAFQSVLDELAPAAFEGGLRLSARARWQAYVQRHAELSGNPAASRRIGPTLVRVYAVVAGTPAGARLPGSTGASNATGAR